MEPDKKLIDFIQKSVETKTPIAFNYQGFQRHVCPFLFGSTIGGRLVLHAFQFGGGTSKGEVTDPAKGAWRFLYLDALESFPAALNCSHWYPADLKKTEDEYMPPKFITRVLAIFPG